MAARVLRGQFPRRGRRQDHLHLVAISVDTEYIAAVAVAPRHGRGVRGAGRGGGGGGGDGYRNCPGRRLRRRGEWGLFSIGTKAVLGAAVVVAARISDILRVGKPQAAQKGQQQQSFGHDLLGLSFVLLSRVATVLRAMVFISLYAPNVWRS